jgi:hypothetical protein
MTRLLLILVAMLPLAFTAPSAAQDGITIDVPVALTEAKVVFNLDHPAFEGDEPTGLAFLRVMNERFKAEGTKADMATWR